MIERFTKEITRGVELLDLYSPVGVSWPYEIDLRRLDMSDWCGCVVGQLYDEGFTFGLEELVRAAGLRVDLSTFANQHGFDVSPLSIETGVVVTLDYAQLGREWVAVIELLRAGRAIPPTSA